VQNAFSALCTSDHDGFISQLTAESRLLFEGLKEIDQDKFACHDLGSFVFEEGRTKEGFVMMRVKMQDAETDVAVVLEEGEWRLDLFRTEEGLLYFVMEEEEAEQ